MTKKKVFDNMAAVVGRQAREAPVQRLADTVAGRFCYTVMAASAATFAFWTLAGAARLRLEVQGCQILKPLNLRHACRRPPCSRLLPLLSQLQLHCFVALISTRCGMHHSLSNMPTKPLA